MSLGYVKVFNNNGEELPPCTFQESARLIYESKAKEIEQSPYTIRLSCDTKYEILEHPDYKDKESFSQHFDKYNATTKKEFNNDWLKWGTWFAVIMFLTFSNSGFTEMSPLSLIAAFVFSMIAWNFIWSMKPSTAKTIGFWGLFILIATFLRSPWRGGRRWW